MYCGGVLLRFGTVGGNKLISYACGQGVSSRGSDVHGVALR